MRFKMFQLAAIAMVLYAGAVWANDSAGRLYGRITTTDGDTYEGIIRWDRNEVSWVDILDGSKEREDSHSEVTKRTRHRPTRIELFGIKIGDINTGDGDLGGGASQCGIRMGQIRSIQADGDDAAIVTLKSGRTVRLTDPSTDFGTDIREIVVEDRDQGETELTWEDLEKVDFMAAKPGAESNLGDRLYGTVTTRRGDQYTGFIAWDADEALGSDILDGEAKDRTRKIRFDRIASLERYSSSATSVNLKGGESLVLRGTNDVDESNRGIVVCDPGFGQVTVSWDEFDKLEFASPKSQVGYDQFDGGRPLHGTVYSEEGDKYTGTIRWDDDEEFTWEMLNGEYRGVNFEIEMGLISRIEKQSSTSSLVTMRDGRTFRLRGSNDVDESNRGVFITPDGGGKTVEVDWSDFTKLELDTK